MLGLVVLAILAVYLLVSGIVVWLASRWAKKHNRRPWVWGGLAALVMYNLVFWDWIPTVAMHKYYCATEAGFWVYKTPEQWVKENPGVLETLTTQRVWQHDHADGGDVVHINQRFDLIYKKEGEFFLHRWRRERQLVDTKTKEIVARYIDFSTGNGSIGGEPELQFWLHRDFCSGGRDKAIQFGQLTIRIKGAEE